MTVHQSENVLRHQADTIIGDAERTAKRKSRKIWALAAAGTLVAGGGAAFAAMAIQSNEATATVEAGQAQQLQLSDATASGKLFPGMSVDLEFTVKNPNPFPVTLTSIVAGSGQPTVSCASPADISKLSTSLGVSGSTLNLASPVVVDPDETKSVTIPKAVKLAPAATGGCSLQGKFKITGTGAGSGN
jgi:hypothetical protein